MKERLKNFKNKRLTAVGGQENRLAAKNCYVTYKTDC
jgi:hypothetical protein